MKTKSIEHRQDPFQEETRTTDTNQQIPDEERRRLLKKIAAAAVTIPIVTVLLDGRNDITFAY